MGVAAGFALATNGCTLIGLGIGSAVPRYESAEQLSAEDIGETVVIGTRAGAAPAVEGTLRGVDAAGALLVTTPGGDRKVAAADVVAVSVEREGRWEVAHGDLVVGDRVRVEPKPIAAQRAEGVYEGLWGGYAFVGGPPPARIDERLVETIRVKRGSYWAVGLVIGLAIDLAVTAYVATDLSSGGGLGGGCCGGLNFH
jgi:hypothetical protein